MRKGRLCVFVKCGLMELDFLRGLYQDIEPGPKNWVYIYPGGDVPGSEIRRLAADSHRMVAPKGSRNQQ